MATTSSSEIGSWVDCSLRRSSIVRVSWVSARNCAHSSRVKRRKGDSSAGRRLTSRSMATPCACPRSLALARRLLLVAALPRAALQFAHHGLKRDAARLQHDEQMIEHVGGFGANRLFVLSCRGDRQFDRLLAELAGAMGGALVQQAAGIGLAAARFGAARDCFGEIVKGEHRRSGSVLSKLGIAGRKKGKGSRTGAFKIRLNALSSGPKIVLVIRNRSRWSVSFGLRRAGPGRRLVGRGR